MTSCSSLSDPPASRYNVANECRIASGPTRPVRSSGSPADLPPDADLGDFIRERITVGTSR